MNDEKGSGAAGLGPRDHIERHRIVFHYLIYENTIFWQRGSFFLLANAALFGFAATLLQRAQPEVSETILSLIVLISLAGLALSYFWIQGLRSGEFWIYHWHKILKEKLERPAFGEIRLLDFTRTPDYPPYIRAKPLAYGPVLVFIILWLFALGYSAYQLVQVSI